MGSDNKIILGIPNRYASHYRETFACRFAFRSTEVAQRLAEFGVTQNKSLTAKVCSQLSTNRDFWRGVIDGDGRLAVINKPSYFNKHPKINAWSRPHQCARLELVGSEFLLQQFLQFVRLLVPGCSATICKHKQIYKVGLAYGTALDVVEALYFNASTALARKENAARNILALRCQRPFAGTSQDVEVRMDRAKAA